MACWRSWCNRDFAPTTAYNGEIRDRAVLIFGFLRKVVNNHLTISRQLQPHPNWTCATPIFHTTESGFRWTVAALENSDVDEVMHYL
jgi:hypothetical protein